MKNLVDLIHLYIEVNQQVISERLNTTANFQRITNYMLDIKRIFNEINIEIDEVSIDSMKKLMQKKTIDNETQLNLLPNNTVSVWNYFYFHSLISDQTPKP